MTRQKRLIALGVSLACVATGITLMIAKTAAQPSRADLWKQVAEADQKGLPRTGIKALEPIIEGAMKDKNYPRRSRRLPRRSTWKATSRGTSRRRKSSACRPRSPSDRPKCTR
jgi:hypothetical protein